MDLDTALRTMLERPIRVRAILKRLKELARDGAEGLDDDLAGGQLEDYDQDFDQGHGQGHGQCFDQGRDISPRVLSPISIV